MKKITLTIPAEQVQIILQSLNVLESALNTLINKYDQNELDSKLFDIHTLKALLNKTELVVNLPMEVYDNFTALNGVDFPEYVNSVK